MARLIQSRRCLISYGVNDKLSTVRHLSEEMLSRYMQIQFREDKNAFKVYLPGWSIDDLNIIARDLYQPRYLRPVRILTKWEHLREIAKGLSFMALDEFEKREATFMKCVSLERKITHSDILKLGRNPYAYDLCFESKLGRIGKSSFQIDNLVKLARNDLVLFSGSLVYVTVDYKTELPKPNPSWWIEQVEKNQNPQVDENFPHLTVNIRNTKGDEKAVFKNNYRIRPAEIDRFGHTNNTVLYNICSDAILEAYSQKHLPMMPTVEYLESCMNRIEVDFVAGTRVGDILTTVVSVDTAQPNKLFCKLFNKDKLACVQALEYDQDVIKMAGKL